VTGQFDRHLAHQQLGQDRAGKAGMAQLVG